MPFAPFVLHKCALPTPLFDRVPSFSGSRVSPLSSGAGDGRRFLGGNVHLHLASFTRRCLVLLYLLLSATYILRTYRSWTNTSLFLLFRVSSANHLNGHPPAPPRSTICEPRVSCQAVRATITLRSPMSVSIWRSVADCICVCSCRSYHFFFVSRSITRHHQHQLCKRFFISHLGACEPVFCVLCGIEIWWIETVFEFRSVRVYVCIL